MVAKTLRAMKEIEYDGPVDVWILDEGNDPEMKRVAVELGVLHFSRKDRPEYNQNQGAYRKRSKAGNHNSWRAEHEWKYDFVAQMDPDHVPLTSFLKRTLGYFRDPDTAFVVAPQVYCNRSDGFVARASAVQGYVFHGIIQRGGNGLGAPLLIGTNHLYRTAAWGQVGGYQDCVIEDHLTSLHVHSRINPRTGRKWKGVYTPDVIARGDGPSTWTDYFNQQKRWAYGVTEIVLRHSPRLFRRLQPAQKWSYAGLQFFYPSLGVVWIMGNLVLGLYLFVGISSMSFSPALPLWWAGALVARICLFLWLRRFNLSGHERREVGLNGMALHLMTGPVYASAVLAAIFHRPLTYVVTAKGALASPDSLRTFQAHFGWLVLMLGALGVGAWRRDTPFFVMLWSAIALCSTILPGLMHALTMSRSRESTPDVAGFVSNQVRMAESVQTSEKDSGPLDQASVYELHVFPDDRSTLVVTAYGNGPSNVNGVLAPALSSSNGHSKTTNGHRSGKNGEENGRGEVSAVAASRIRKHSEPVERPKIRSATSGRS